MIVPFILAGIGMGLFFAPIANVVLSAVRPDQEGKASGATNTIREVGGVFGVAVLAAIFSANGDYATPAAYVAGLQPAIAVGAVVVGSRRPRRAVRSRPGPVPAAPAIERAERARRRAPRPRRARLAPARPPAHAAGYAARPVAYPAAMPSVVSHVRAADGTDLLVRHWPADEAEAGGAWAGPAVGLGPARPRPRRALRPLRARRRPAGRAPASTSRLRPSRHRRLGRPARRRRALVAATTTTSPSGCRGPGAAAAAVRSSSTATRSAA